MSYNFNLYGENKNEIPPLNLAGFHAVLIVFVADPIELLVRTGERGP